MNNWDNGGIKNRRLDILDENSDGENVNLKIVYARVRLLLGIFTNWESTLYIPY